MSPGRDRLRTELDGHTPGGLPGAAAGGQQSEQEDQRAQTGQRPPGWMARRRELGRGRPARGNDGADDSRTDRLPELAGATLAQGPLAQWLEREAFNL